MKKYKGYNVPEIGDVKIKTFFRDYCTNGQFSCDKICENCLFLRLTPELVQWHKERVNFSVKKANLRQKKTKLATTEKGD